MNSYIRNYTQMFISVILYMNILHCSDVFSIRQNLRNQNAFSSKHVSAFLPRKYDVISFPSWIRLICHTIVVHDQKVCNDFDHSHISKVKVTVHIYPKSVSGRYLLTAKFDLDSSSHTYCPLPKGFAISFT